MGMPPWFGEQRKANNRKSRQYERKLAKQRGGRTSAGSGSSWRNPQDVTTPEELIQHKFSRKRTHNLDVRELAAIRADALRAGREPELIIDFEGHGIRARILIEDA